MFLPVWRRPPRRREATLIAAVTAAMILATAASARQQHNPVVVTVDGPGHVTGQSSTGEGQQVNCPPTCYVSVPFENGATYTLTATHNPGAQFVGWFNDCASVGTNPTCTLSGEHYFVVYARFANFYPLQVSVAGTGTGAITGSRGLQCRASCTAQVPQNLDVTLSAAPDSGSTFAGWNGACSGTGQCKLTVQGGVSVAATFNDVMPPSLTALASGGLVGRTVKLHYRATDNSNAASLQGRVLRGKKMIARITAPSTSLAKQGLRWIPWTAPSNLTGTFRFCLTAIDAAGNKSAPSCAPLKLKS
jgi:hypothetical protein